MACRNEQMSLEGSLLVPVLVCLSLTIDDQSKGNSSLLAKMGSGKGLWLDSGPWGCREIGSESSGNSVSVLRRHRKRGPFLSPDVVMSRYDARNRCGHLMRGTKMRPSRQHAEDDEAKRKKDTSTTCDASLAVLLNSRESGNVWKSRHRLENKNSFL